MPERIVILAAVLIGVAIGIYLVIAWIVRPHTHKTTTPHLVSTAS